MVFNRSPHEGIPTVDTPTEELLGDKEVGVHQLRMWRSIPSIQPPHLRLEVLSHILAYEAISMARGMRYLVGPLLQLSDLIYANAVVRRSWVTLVSQSVDERLRDVG